MFTKGWGVDRPQDERCVPNLSTGKYSPQIPTLAEHRMSLEMLVARKPGMNWETGREYLKDSVLNLSVNRKGNRRSGAGDRFSAIAILTAVAVGTVTGGAVVVMKYAIVKAWNWTTVQIRGILKDASWAVLVVAGVT